MSLTVNEAAQTKQLCVFPGCAFLFHSIASLPCASLLAVCRKSRHRGRSCWTHLFSDFTQLHYIPEVVSVVQNYFRVHFCEWKPQDHGFPDAHWLSFSWHAENVSIVFSFRCEWCLDFHWVSPAAGTKCSSVCVFLL